MSNRSAIGLAGVSLLALIASSPPALAAPAEPVLSFAIPRGPLEKALTAYATRADIQLLYSPGVVRGLHSEGLTGDFTAKAALAKLLAGTGIVAQESRPGVIVLRIGVVATPLATATTEVAATPSMLDEVVVTGTHIRGVAPGASPVVSVDRDAIDRRGFATVADTLAALPQNFAGLATPAATSTGVDTTSQNAGRATTINLRGLGPDATLVLVNGRRMAGAGGRGDLADVSSIPTAAVERIDVLLDGASALYGADAVAGVVNIILRNDFDGAETRARVGAARGGGEELQFAQTLGRTWSSGRILGAYEYYERQALSFADRSYTRSADLRPMGGTDHRSVNASPGNVLIVDPASGLTRPGWAIPAGATSFPLRPSDFRAGEVNLTGLRDGMDLLPHQKRHSLYLSAGQEIHEGIEIDGEVRYAHRTSQSASLASTATITIASNNPYFASPNGSRSHQIAYSFLDELGNTRADSTVESLGTAIGLKADLWSDWRLEAYGAYARELTKSSTKGSVNSLFLREAVGATADNPATAFRAAVDGYFNPYGPNSRAVLDFVGSGYSRQRYEGETWSLNAQGDGKLWTIAGGDIRLAVGLHARREAFDQETESFTSAAVPTISRPSTFKRDITAAFAELRAPIIGQDNALPGVRRLELSLAARIEHYEGIGSTTNPKVGLVWEPSEDLRLRASYGTSFRAPLLSEVHAEPLSAAAFYNYRSGRILAINLSGGNADLDPETATSWTVGFDWRPGRIAGLELSATFFDTAFENQIDRPTTRFIQQGLDHPAIAPFVRFVDPSNSVDLAYVQSLIDAPGYLSGTLYPASAIGVVVDSRFVNTGATHVRGVDLSATYDFEVGENDFDLAASLSYLADYELQLTPTSATDNYVDLAGQPVDLRGRVSASWRRGDYGGLIAANYVDDYRDTAGQRVESWTTFDAQMSWTPSAAALSGLSLSFTVQNLFDTPPPFVDGATGVGYDPANADPVGRYASISLTKRW
ncbi:TonB-dependent receptor [Phenylobacterium sp. 58.2.17]|jgi:iron complex outermembrane recepter protein|nr:TonB-dependent receptor [Phenylobacterium sp. 58.2.17]MCX7586321.1 TonB-dependent receptor [Phenylobacterium sp. 58.2.17]